MMVLVLALPLFLHALLASRSVSVPLRGVSLESTKGLCLGAQRTRLQALGGEFFDFSLSAAWVAAALLAVGISSVRTRCIPAKIAHLLFGITLRTPLCSSDCGVRHALIILPVFTVCKSVAHGLPVNPDVSGNLLLLAVLLGNLYM